MQEIGAVVVLALALAYLGWRIWRRRGANCCGEAECPAAKQMLAKALEEVGRTRRGPTHQDLA